MSESPYATREPYVNPKRAARREVAAAYQRQRLESDAARSRLLDAAQAAVAPSPAVSKRPAPLCSPLSHLERVADASDVADWLRPAERSQAAPAKPKRKG